MAVKTDITVSVADELRSSAAELRTRLKRVRGTLLKQEAELVAAASWVVDRQIADSILSSLGSLCKGEQETILHNEHTGADVIIRLNPKLSPRENADLYYRKARKGERGELECREKVQVSLSTIADLEGLQQHIEALRALGEADPEFPSRFESLCSDPLYCSLSNRPAAGAKKAPPAPEKVPYRLYTYMGYAIWVGRNDTQNDELSTRFAKPWHIWLHVASHAGSHVVIGRPKNSPLPPAEVLSLAAAFSVWFSKAKHTSFAEVHYTEARFVCKRRKAPPGEVQLSSYKTLRVAPISPQVFFKGQTVDD